MATLTLTLPPEIDRIITAGAKKNRVGKQAEIISILCERFGVEARLTRGRPRTKKPVETDAPKRGRGRPRKAAPGKSNP